MKTLLVLLCTAFALTVSLAIWCLIGWFCFDCYAECPRWFLCLAGFMTANATLKGLADSLKFTRSL